MTTLNKVKNQVHQIGLKFGVVIIGHIYGPMGDQICSKMTYLLPFRSYGHKQGKKCIFLFLHKMGSFLAVTPKQ